MGLHKLTAGDGYTYLTRQVAAHDSTVEGPTGLGDYYAQRGESPDRWFGAGLAGLDMSPGDEVTAAQMEALFGAGRHPRANTLTLELIFTTGFDTDDTFEQPDNICVSPYGGLMICEDSTGENYMIGTTADGEPFVFARNRQELEPGETGELAGVSFSPDGRIMFFNVYNPGTTFAVTGPWRRQN